MFALAAICFTACGRAPADTANSNAERSAAVSPFASLTDAAAAMAEGDRLFDENNTELAIEAYKRAVEIDPELAEAYFKLGIAYGLLEKEKMQAGGAEILPGEVTKEQDAKKPDSVKMFEKAVAAYKKQLAANGDNAAAYFNLGRAYNKLNKDEEAEDALERASKLEPKNIEYLTELGAIRIKLAKYREAMAALKKALEIDPDNPEATDLYETAEAGAKRVEFSGPKIDANKAPGANTAANTADANIASNTAAPANKPVERPPPPPPSSRPNQPPPAQPAAPKSKKGDIAPLPQRPKPVNESVSY